MWIQQLTEKTLFCSVRCNANICIENTVISHTSLFWFSPDCACFGLGWWTLYLPQGIGYIHPNHDANHPFHACNENCLSIIRQFIGNSVLICYRRVAVSSERFPLSNSGVLYALFRVVHHSHLKSQSFSPGQFLTVNINQVANRMHNHNLLIWI